MAHEVASVTAPPRRLTATAAPVVAHHGVLTSGAPIRLPSVSCSEKGELSAAKIMSEIEHGHGRRWRNNKKRNRKQKSNVLQTAYRPPTDHHICHKSFVSTSVST